MHLVEFVSPFSDPDISFNYFNENFEFNTGNVKYIFMKMCNSRFIYNGVCYELMPVKMSLLTKTFRERIFFSEFSNLQKYFLKQNLVFKSFVRKMPQKRTLLWSCGHIN